MPTDDTPGEEPRGDLSAPPWVVRAWHRIRRPLTRRPGLYATLNRLRPTRRGLLVRPDSVLVIEGPMRSANTYAVAAFRLSNPDVGHVGRHLHAPAHVLRAVQLEVPAVVLVRHPADVAVSHVVRRPELSLSDSLRDYIDYYETLAGAADAVVVATFEDVTSDFGGVIERVNGRFGTAFRRYRPTEQNERRVRRIIDAMNRAEQGGAVDERRVARPSPDRDQQLERMRQELARGPVAALLGRAEEIHGRWVSLSRR